MCGIGGILRNYSPGGPVPSVEQSIPDTWLDTIDQAIKHRGPDGHGRFRDRVVRPNGSVIDVALVHRRLAIIDPACGQQPMVSERGLRQEGLVAVVMNGCIYNHRDLRSELEGHGRRFVTDHSDTEVLIHGWRQWGPAMFDRLVGMAVVLLWDRASTTFAWYRSAPGEKPLYKGNFMMSPNNDQSLAFASSAEAMRRVRRLDGLVPERNALLTTKWIAFGHHAIGTMDLTVSQVEYGRPYSISSGEMDGHPTMDVDWPQYPSSGVLPGDPPRGSRWRRTPPRSSDLEALVDAALDKSVRQRLEADVPVACLLSGGVDSSVVAHYAKRALGQLTTVCVRMPDPRYDESSHAARVASHLGTAHHTVDVAPRPAEDLVMLIRQLDLPFGDSSLLPTYWACKAARQYAKVVLTGDGGDELFYGYERYLAAKHIHHLGQFAASFVPLFLFSRQDPTSRSAKTARFVEASRLRSYAHLLALFGRRDLRRLIGKEAGVIKWDGAGGGVAGARDYDLYETLPGDMLRKLDAASMSVPIETRAPFLDQGLVREFRFLRPRQAMPHGQRKGLLRAVARRYLPAGIVDRPKQGFAIPIGDWFRNDYGSMKTLLMDHLNSAEPWPNIKIDINRRFVQQMVDQHMNLRRDHSQRLYMLLVLSIWAKAVLA